MRHEPGCHHTHHHDEQGKKQSAAPQHPDLRRIALTRRQTGQHKVPCQAGGQRIESRTQRAHGRGQHSGNDQTTQPGRQLMHDEVGEHLPRFGRQPRIGEGLIKRAQHDAHQDEGTDHGQIHQTRDDGGHSALAAIARRQHPLHRVLVNAVRAHRHEGAANQRRPQRVLAAEDMAQTVPPPLLGRRSKIEKQRRVGHRHHPLPALRDSTEKIGQRESQCGQQDQHLNAVRPNHGADSTHRGVDGREPRHHHHRQGIERKLFRTVHRPAAPGTEGQHQNDR